MLADLIISLALAVTMQGEVTYYNPHIMESVYQQRLQWRHVQPCPACIGMIAVLEPQHLGQRAWLQRPGHPLEGPFLIVDCAASHDRARLRARGLIAEVDWPTARRWRMAGPLRDVRLLILAASTPAARSRSSLPNRLAPV